MLFLATGIVVLVLMTCGLAEAEEECMYSKIWCYDCNSKTDPRCRDPFNHSAPHTDQPVMNLCQGCCVKVVMHFATPKETVWRTCTTSLQINLFLVDHVCMHESGGQGHMCFCESDGCNAATIPNVSWLILLLSPLLLAFQAFTK